MSKVEADNVIKVYYVSTQNAKVEYYYDGVIDATLSETLADQAIGSTISTYTDKEKAGFRFSETENLPLTVSNVEADNVIKVYYVSTQNAKVEYYYDGEIDETLSETLADQAIGSTISMYEDKVKEGFRFSETMNFSLTVSKEEADNVIKVYYVSTQNAKIEYYYDGVIDETLSETLVNQAIGSTITTYTDKIKDGFRFSETKNLPLTVDADVTKNVIKVYYIRVLENERANATIEYYYDGVQDQALTEALVDQKIGLTIDTYTDKPKEGFIFSHTENLPLTVNVDPTKNVIKVFYVSNQVIDKANVTVEYYYVGILDDTFTENLLDQVVGATITTYVDKPKQGYQFSETENLPLLVSKVDTDNVIKVFYVSVPEINNANVTVEYYYDGIIDATLTETLLDQVVGATITTFVDKPKQGYQFSETKNLPLTVSKADSDNVIKVYYVHIPEIIKAHVTIEYYYNGIMDNEATITLQDQVIGSKIETYTDKLKEGYIFSNTENLPLIVEQDSTKNVIRIYYIRKDIESNEPPINKNERKDIETGDFTSVSNLSMMLFGSATLLLVMMRKKKRKSKD